MPKAKNKRKPKVKNKSNPEDTGKQIKKTLSKLSFAEKVQKNQRLFKEHILEEVRGDSIVIFSCKTCELFNPTINKVLASRHASSHNLPRKRKREHVRRYDCAFCEKSLKTKKEHVKHYQENHCQKGMETLSCTKCFKCFDDLPSLSSHISVAHKPESQVCAECGKVFGSRRLLNRHIKMVHKGLKAVACDVCGKKFRDHYGVQRHTKNVHKAVAHEAQDSEVNDFIKDRSKCPLCSKEVKKVNWHLKMTHGVDKNLNPTVSSYKHHCEGCDKPFIDKCNLERHLHSCEKKNLEDVRKCNICSKTFSSKKNKEIHMKEMHLIAKVCEKCQVNFKDKTDFYLHLPCQFSCKCGKKFSAFSKFDRHMKMCNGSGVTTAATNQDKSAYHNVISYYCILCEGCDLRFDEVKDHISDHHSITSVNIVTKCHGCNVDVLDLADHIFNKHSKVRRLKKTYVKLGMEQILAVKSKPTHFDIISDDLGGGESPANYLENFMVDSQEVVGSNIVEDDNDLGSEMTNEAHEAAYRSGHQNRSSKEENFTAESQEAGGQVEAKDDGPDVSSGKYSTEEMNQSNEDHSKVLTPVKDLGMKMNESEAGDTAVEYHRKGDGVLEIMGVTIWESKPAVHRADNIDYIESEDAVDISIDNILSEEPEEVRKKQLKLDLMDSAIENAKADSIYQDKLHNERMKLLQASIKMKEVERSKNKSRAEVLRKIRVEDIKSEALDSLGHIEKMEAKEDFTSRKKMYFGTAGELQSLLYRQVWEPFTDHQHGSYNIMLGLAFILS